MKIMAYAERGSQLAFAYGDETAHHWHIDVTGDEYVELIGRLKSMEWIKQLRWYPKYVPSELVTGTKLQMHIMAHDDRDATMFKLSL